jgi:hypothetical protein
MKHSRRSIERERRRALAALIDTTHWLTLPAAAAAIPCDLGRLRAYLKGHELPCDWCPVYRRRGRGRAARALSPADVRRLREVLVFRKMTP